jgi:hypothetical protein
MSCFTWGNVLHAATGPMDLPGWQDGTGPWNCTPGRVVPPITFDHHIPML